MAETLFQQLATITELFYGSYVEFHNNNMLVNGTYERQGYHANHSLWAYSKDGTACTSRWAEEGVTQGFEGQVAYTYYYAFRVASGYAEHAAEYTTPDGSNHSYWIQYESDDNSYDILRDGAYVRQGLVGLSAGTCISQAGLEMTNPPDGTTSSFLTNYNVNTFDLNPLRYQDSSYVFHTGWDTSQYWITLACGRGYTSPYCTNGVYYSPSHWADNKP